MHEHIMPLIGGILIGTSTTILLYTTGRFVGISGFVPTSISSFNKENLWKIAFLFGLITGGVFLHFLKPELISYQTSFPLLRTIFAGFLVGIGTRVANGCTSRHGVCGVSRLSKRSILATKRKCHHTYP